MSIDFSGFNENALTFIAGEGLKKGMPVKITASKTVSPCASGENFCGVCEDVRDGYCTVVLSGYVNMPATRLISTGFQKLGAGADGTVVSSTTGREYLVLDSTADTVGFIL